MQFKDLNLHSTLIKAVKNQNYPHLTNYSVTRNPFGIKEK